jgi:hypothetical protein
MLLKLGGDATAVVIGRHGEPEAGRESLSQVYCLCTVIDRVRTGKEEIEDGKDGFRSRISVVMCRTRGLEGQMRTAIRTALVNLAGAHDGDNAG